MSGIDRARRHRDGDVSFLWRRLRDFFNAQTELQERLLLLNQPWLEDFTHWSGSEDDPHLHGYLPPPAVRPQHSVTRNGWCPAAGHTSRTQAEGNHVAG